MNNQTQIAALAAAAGAAPNQASKGQLNSKTASLRSSATMAGVEVHLEKGIIHNAAVITAGPTKGHGFVIDQTSLSQVAALIDAAPNGVTVRFRHPEETPRPGEPIPETLGTDVGYLRNAHVVGDAVRGDVYLADYAEVLPGLGNVKDYLLRKAKSDPTGFGLSAVIAFDVEEITTANGTTALAARVGMVQAIDFVAIPAANPNGLLSAATPPPSKPQPSTQGKKPMKAKLKQYLQANHGLAADASDDAAQTMYDGLSAEHKAAADKASEDAPTTKDPVKPGSTSTTSTGATINNDLSALTIEKEGQRVAHLRQLGSTLGVKQEVVNLAIADGDDVASARTRYLSHLKETAKPIQNLSVQVGVDQKVAALRAALPEAITLRAGGKVEKPHELASKFRYLTVLDMYRHYLIALGAKAEEVHFMPRPALVDVMGPRSAMRHFGVAMLAQGVGSFDAVLLDAANKTARQEYLLAPSTWNIWARRNTAPDFKNINRVQLSDSPGLVARNEGGEIKYAVLTDSNQSYVLAEYVNGLRLTRKALVNDDLDMFSRIPRSQMNAAKQLEDDVAYAALNSTANMSDGNQLFSTAHSNYSSVTAQRGPISVTTLGYGRSRLRQQKGPGGNRLNLIPKYLIVPTAQESLAEQYTSSAYTATAQSVINPFAQGGRTPLIPVVEPRMDSYSTTAWILAADYSTVDTVEVCFLDGESEPVIKQETDFDTDDLKFAVRHTVAAQAIDFRGLDKNTGG